MLTTISSRLKDKRKNYDSNTLSMLIYDWTILVYFIASSHSNKQCGSDWMCGFISVSLNSPIVPCQSLSYVSHFCIELEAPVQSREGHHVGVYLFIDTMTIIQIVIRLSSDLRTIGISKLVRKNNFAAFWCI